MNIDAGRRRAFAAFASAALVAPLRAQPPEPFDFIALGDMPYGPDLTTGPAYRQLIDQINDEGLPLSIHVGDFKDGVSTCSDELYAHATTTCLVFELPKTRV